MSLLKLMYLFSFSCIFIECIIPGQTKLSVIKLDQSLINRKRQDTLEMCRIFNEENDKVMKNLLHSDESTTESSNKIHLRPKRDAASVVTENSLVKEEDAARVEKIVDKIYDDMNEKIEYTRLNLTEKAKTEDQSDVTNVTNDTKSDRRFNFAPETLIVRSTERPKIVEDVRKGPPVRFQKGIVPYFIDPKTYDAHLIDLITNIFQQFEKQTCIRLLRLRERPTDMQSLHTLLWIYISNPSGIRQCVHSNDKAKIQGVQLIVFGYDCMSQGDVMHELMHVLGFPHEHTRPDRDQHITIMWDNIKPGYRKYFEADKSSFLSEFPYDYASVLHYPPRAFSRNGKVTIWTEPGIKIGQRDRLSEIDLQKIDMLYSEECLIRNKEYLLSTCPSAVNSKPTTTQVTPNEIKQYFKDRLWPYGVVYYKIPDLTEFTLEELDNIRSVIRHIERETCIEFRDMTVEQPPETAETNSSTVHSNPINETEFNAAFAKVHNKSDSDNFISKDEQALRYRDNVQFPWPPKALKAAVASVLLSKSDKPGCVCPPAGNPGYEMKLNLSSDCFNTVNDLLHVFVHILGLDHQHNMHDRDDYILILWEQFTEEISKDMKKKLPPAASAGFPYDYQSVMHCPWMQIKNGHTNPMYPIWNDGWAMGQWEGLSAIDVQKLNLIYYDQCSKRKELPQDIKQ